jgi:hypothetical protein
MSVSTKNSEADSETASPASPGMDNRAQGRQDLPGVMIVLVVAGVIGFIGLQVMSTVIDQTTLASGDPLYNASDSLQTSIEDAWGLIGVAFIVVILAVIVVYLYGLRGR